MLIMVLINKKEYPDGVFENVYNKEYFNLKIYPLVGILEKEAGLLSDIAEAYLEEGFKTNCVVYGDSKSADIPFISDNLLNFEQVMITTDEFLFTKSYKTIIYSPEYFPNVTNAEFVLSNQSQELSKLYKFKLKITNKFLYFNDKSFFHKHFWYYFPSGQSNEYFPSVENEYFKGDSFNYDNLICYTMIIKNGGPLLEQVLIDNLPVIDRWCILDTGSTDGTQEVIKRVLKNKKGKLYEEPFVDFKISRNRCLDLAGHTCKFILMLDDTYSIRSDLRSFLDEVRGDQFSDSFSLMIQSSDNEYYSNRIIKSTTNLRYIHTIHEVITNENNINVTVPIDRSYIFDNRADYMEQRTNNRKQFDLQLLFKEVENDPDDPRALYYIAQTYGCIGDEVNKAKYFELRINHPNEGYVQEKIDACFELGRTYNFKVNCETKELIKSEKYKLSQSQWKRCEELYLQAYSLDQKRPDSLYFIGIHYYLEGNHDIAYKYFKLGFEVGYPLGSQYSLKPTLSFHFLPKFLTELCYYNSDYSLGLAAAQLFLTSTKYNSPEGESWNLMLNWYNIHTQLLKMGPIVQLPKKPTNKKVICIVTDGGWEPWSGKDILTKGMGGSETWIIETARYLAKTLNNYDVCVFCKTKESEFFEEVGYNPVELFPNFIANNIVELCIISRYTEYVPVALKGHAQNIGIIFHDVLQSEMIIPDNIKIKWIFGLTDWHTRLIQQTFPQFTSKVHKINYGIDSKKFHSSEKIKNSFIYSSFPNRGLMVLLRMWPRIISEFPDSTLNIYCNLEQEWVNKVAPDDMREIKALLKVNKKGVKVHGWVSKEILAQAWNTSEYFLYPCKFEETFCLTAVEAAISKTFVISNNLAALEETVGDRGLIVHGSPLTEEWQNSVISELRKYMLGDCNELKNELIEKNYQWAKERSWESQTHKFIEILFNNPEPMLNWTNDVPKGTKAPFMDSLKLLPINSKLLEIGTYSGTGIVEMLKIVPNSTATVIDLWEDYYEYDQVINKQTNVNNSASIEKEFYNNIGHFRDRIRVLKGKSHDKLLELLMKHESFNFIYVDASHQSLDVYLDSMLAWKLLKIGGIIVFDDYLFNKGDILNSPYEAIEKFKKNYIDDIVILHQDYRVYLKKIN